MAVRWAREHGLPYFGICLGLQIAIIEFARNVCAPGGHQQHRVPARLSVTPVISLLPSQRGVQDMGGTMRLGAYPAQAP